MTTTATMDFDHVELLIGSVESAADANAKAVRNTVLSPRFYTTDFAAMDRLNIESVRAEWDVMMKEYEGDNNHDHFQRDAQFAEEVKTLMPQLSPEMRQEFFRLPHQLPHLRIFWLHFVQRSAQKCHQPRHQAAHDLYGAR